MLGLTRTKAHSYANNTAVNSSGEIAALASDSNKNNNKALQDGWNEMLQAKHPAGDFCLRAAVG